MRLVLWFAIPFAVAGYFGILFADGLCRTREGWPESDRCECLAEARQGPTWTRELRAAMCP